MLHPLTYAGQIRRKIIIFPECATCQHVSVWNILKIMWKLNLCSDMPNQTSTYSSLSSYVNLTWGHIYLRYGASAIAFRVWIGCLVVILSVESCVILQGSWVDGNGYSTEVFGSCFGYLFGPYFVGFLLRFDQLGHILGGEGQAGGLVVLKVKLVDPCMLKGMESPKTGHLKVVTLEFLGSDRKVFGKT